MLHAVSTTTFDPDGFVEIDAVDYQSAGETRRRVSRVATLDGEAAFNDFGYSAADRVIELRWTPALRATEQAVARIVETYSRVQVATRDGVFLAAPESYTPGKDESRLRLLVVEKLSE